MKKARMRLETLKMLREKIKSAVASKTWTSELLLHQDTVQMLVKEATVVLAEIANSAVTTKFSTFLANLLLQSSAYKD